MDDLTKLTVEDFLDQVTDRRPTPGGGSVTGAAGALACSLARMVAAFSVSRNTDLTARTQVETAAKALHRLDQIIRALITQDAVAYAEMSATAKGVPQAAATDAVLAAVAVPMEMAALASNVLAIMDEFKMVANRRLLTDLAIAALLADTTARAARYTVQINVRQLTDEKNRTKILADIDSTVQHCCDRRESIEAFVARSAKREGRILTSLF